MVDELPQKNFELPAEFFLPADHSQSAPGVGSIEGELPPMSRVSEASERPLARPSLTLSEAASVCGISRSTIRRRHEAGDFPSAFKDSEGSWRIPVTDLLSAGLKPGRPSPPDQVSEPDEQVRAAVVSVPLMEFEQLREQLTAERLRAAVAEAKLSERSAVIDAYKEALSEARQRAIEAAPAAPTDPSGGVVVDLRTPPPVETVPLTWREWRKARKVARTLSR